MQTLPYLETTMDLPPQGVNSILGDALIREWKAQALAPIVIEQNVRKTERERGRFPRFPFFVEGVGDNK